VDGNGARSLLESAHPMADTPSLPDGPALIVVGGPTDGEVFPLEKDRATVVGSGRLADLRLGPSDISSAHLKVTWDDAGLFVNDNVSFTGTYLNGETVEQAPLQDGDLLGFADPKDKPDWPKVRLHVPPGSVIIAAPPPEPEPPPAEPVEPKLTAPAPPPAARPAAARAPVRGRAPVKKGRTIPGLGGVDPKIAAAAGGGLLALVLLVFLIVRFFFGPTPTIASIQPTSAEPGQSVIIAGDRFADETANNVVRFGDVLAKVTTAGETSLNVIVPDALPGDATVTVQVGRRRSKPADFKVLKTLRISAFEPEVALPNEEVTVKGSGLDSAGLELTVEGRPAQILGAEATSLRFRVPALAIQPVRGAPVLLRTKEQLAKPMELMIGKLPLVVNVSPRVVEAGDKLTLKGKGFAPQPQDNNVLFGRVRALVLAASPAELTVVAPDLGMAGPAPLTVEALGRSSTAATPVQVGAGSSATYRLRFFAAPGETPGQVFVSMAAAPTLVFAAKDEASSVEERAVQAAAVLNRLADAASQGRPAAVEARNPPALAVSGGEVIARVTEAEASTYGSAAPTVAAHWAALIGDYLAMFVRGERPTRLFSTTGRARALLDLQSEVGFRPGAGVTASRMAQLSAESQQKLREMSLQLSPPAQGQSGAAVEGVWEGELRDSDGTTKAVVVEIRFAGGRLSGTLALGRKVALRVPLQDLAVQGGTLRFTVRRSGTVHAFESPISAGEVSGPLHEGSIGGPAVGRLTLRYARAPG
jgi:IPT/TIG domain/Inner membrane component of T3SS, cytoplasmic domain